MHPPGVTDFALKSGTEPQSPPLDRAIAALAARQYGVVALAQLLALGLSAPAVRHRVACGRLHRTYRGVYTVGHPVVGAEGRWLAAVLACGPGAVLSHRSAAALHRLRPTSRAKIDVIVPASGRRPRAGIDLHASMTFEAATARGIPCTGVARTLLDLTEVIDASGLDAAIQRAEILQLFDLRDVDAVLAGANGRRGAPRLRRALARYRPHEAFTRSTLERLFFALCSEAELPRPLVNNWIDDQEVDFCWPDRRLVVQTDGRETHDTTFAFEDDRRRDQRLVVAGWRVVRFIWRQVTDEPEDVVRTLRGL